MGTGVGGCHVAVSSVSPVWPRNYLAQGTSPAHLVRVCFVCLQAAALVLYVIIAKRFRYRTIEDTGADFEALALVPATRAGLQFSPSMTRSELRLPVSTALRVGRSSTRILCLAGTQACGSAGLAPHGDAGVLPVFSASPSYRSAGSNLLLQPSCQLAF